MEAALRGALAEEGGGGESRNGHPEGPPGGTPDPGTPPGYAPARPSVRGPGTRRRRRPLQARRRTRVGGAAGPRPVPGGEHGAARTAPPPRRNKAPRGRASGRAALTADRRASMRGPGTFPGRAGAERPLQSASCEAGAAGRQPR